ncbi:hypothetical protein ACFQUU_27935 [Herbaspirillum sp. GCM10030257]|uniref:hypothetical protein n=1 Tax=Herbaspirillum sp. GCM10030257 TaxID=3273393 RepID=UPI00360D1A12
MKTYQCEHPLFAALKGPEKFSRENRECHLYVTFSKKVRREIHLYSHARYDLWTELESNPEIDTFNEWPPQFPAACGDSIFYFRPSFITRGIDGTYQVHLIDSSEILTHRLETAKTASSSESIADPLAGWAIENQCTVVRWQISALRSNRLRLANLKQLMRFACFPNRYVPTDVIAEATAVLRHQRTVTVDFLIQSLRQFDESWVQAAIAALILDRKVHSDINRFAFNYSTQLSIFHEIK